MRNVSLLPRGWWLGKGEANDKSPGAASGAGHGRDVGDLVIRAGALDELVEIEGEEMAATLPFAERHDLHVAHFDVAESPVAHGDDPFASERGGAGRLGRISRTWMEEADRSVGADE
jgi:hypothetical protein